MSKIELQKDGSLDMILTGQTEFTMEELQRITPLQSKIAILGAMKIEFKDDIEKSKIKLLESPEYRQLKKLEEKLSMARKLEKETTIILNNELKKVFKRNKVISVSDTYCDLLPEAPVKTGKRGRPRLTAGTVKSTENLKNMINKTEASNG